MPPKKGKTPALHVKCDPIPVGTVITDTKKLEITVQKEFAQGGFGRICDAKVKGNTAKYIIKFEPTDNGPLFNENHLYPRILTQTALQKYTSEHKLKFLGLPHCVSSGVYKDVRYLVMPKYDYTLEQLIKEKKGVLPLGNAISVVLSVLDSLEYIHSCDYAHGDIKAGNLMLMSKTDFTKVYLIDYGLAKKISKPVEKDDPKKAHNGTALFNSMDAHRGCGPSFRGDIEILAHNVLLWLTGKLPWKDLEDNPNAVQSAKADLLSNIPKNVKALVPDQKSAALLITLYDAAKKLKIEQKPNFAAIKKAIGSPEAASKRKRGAAESEEEVEKPTPRSRARKQESEGEEEEEVEEKPKPRGRGRVKKESEAPTEPEEEAQEPKPSKSRPRKAGAAIAAAKKSKVIYPGLNKKPSTEKSDDDEESAEEAPPPVPKKSKPPTTKPSTVRSRRPPASDSPAASSSEDLDLDAVSTSSNIENMARTMKTAKKADADEKKAAEPTRERLGRRAKDNAPAILENSVLVGRKTAKSARAQKADAPNEDEVKAKRGRAKKEENPESDTDDKPEAGTKPSSSKAVVKKKAAAPKKDAKAKPASKTAAPAASEDDEEEGAPPVKKQKTDPQDEFIENLSDFEEPAPSTKPTKAAAKAKKGGATKKSAKKEEAEDNVVESEQEDAPKPTKPAPKSKKAVVSKKKVEKAAEAVDGQSDDEEPAPEPPKSTKTAKNAAKKVAKDATNEEPEDDVESEEPAPSKPLRRGRQAKTANVEKEAPPARRGQLPKAAATEKINSEEEQEVEAKKPGPSKPTTKRGRKAKLAEKAEEEQREPASSLLSSPEPVVGKGEAPDLPLRAEGEEAMDVDEVIDEEPEESPTSSKTAKKAPKPKAAANAEPESPTKPVGIIPGVTKNMKSPKAVEAFAAKQAAEAEKEAAPAKPTRGKRGAAKTTAEEVDKPEQEEAPKPAPTGRAKRGAATKAVVVEEEEEPKAPVSPPKKKAAAKKAKAVESEKEADADGEKPQPSSTAETGRGKRGAAKKGAAGDADAEAEKPSASGRPKRGAKPVVDEAATESEEAEPPITPPKKKAPAKQAPAKSTRIVVEPEVEEDALLPAAPVVSDFVVARPKKGRKIKDDDTLSAPSSPANPIIPGLSKNLKSEKAKAALAVKEAAYAAASSSKTSARRVQETALGTEEPMEVDEPEQPAPSRKRPNDEATFSKPAKAPRTESPMHDDSAQSSDRSAAENINFSISAPVPPRKPVAANDSFASEKGTTSANAIIPGVTEKMKTAKAREAYALKTGAAAEKETSPKPSSSTTEDRRTPSFIVPTAVNRPRRAKK